MKCAKYTPIPAKSAIYACQSDLGIQLLIP